jgi:hypothetical protein
LTPLICVHANSVGPISLGRASLTLLARRLTQHFRVPPLHCGPVRLFLILLEGHSKLSSTGLEIQLSNVQLSFSFIGQSVTLVGDFIPGGCGEIAVAG